MAGAVDMKYLVKGAVHEAAGFDGTTIRYSSRGRGTALVTCNGVANTTTFWHHFEDHFSTRARVICWDYRGHGRSDSPADPDTFGIECHARDLEAVLDAAGIEKAVLAGFSMGVQVILEFYRERADRVLALVCVNGPCSNPMEAFGTSKAFERLYTRLFEHFAEHPEILEAVGVPLLMSPVAWPVATLVEIDRRRASKAEMKLYFEHLAKMGFANELRALSGMSVHSAEDVLAKVSVPTLVIAGEKDGMCPARLVKKVHRGIRGSELFVVPGGSHGTLIEEPELVNYRVESFLRRNALL